MPQTHTQDAHWREIFEARFGPGGRLRAAMAPGRSNLIGEHTDYNGGLVLPIAVNRRTVVLFRAQRSGGAPRLALYSDLLDSADEFPLSGLKPVSGEERHWSNYVRGTAWALEKRGVKLKGGDFYITGDLPRGAGLSSSAALEVSAGLALLALAGQRLSRQELAYAGQEAEHQFAGVRCGIMDQTVVCLAKAGHALLLDTQTMTVQHTPIHMQGYSFGIFDTGVRHKLAASEYNKRRAECEHAAQVLGHPFLRGVTLEDLLRRGGRLTPGEHKRLRHVVTENLRVTQFAAALARGDHAEMGRLLASSHLSLARDYEVSCPELDAVVAALNKQHARDGACPGARMTGGGCGGAVVALLKTSAVPAYAKALRRLAPGGSLLLAPSGGAFVVNI